MNIKETIQQNLQLLSPQEQLLAHWIIDNLDKIDELSLKNISKKLNVKESVITKTLQKVGLVGFKNLKQLLKSSVYLQNFSENEEFINNWYQNFAYDSRLTINSLDINKMQEIALKISQEKKEVVIFATGKTKIIAEFFYFTLIEYGLKCHLFSSLYQYEAFDLTNKIVFLISISGKNSKVNRYLNIIKKQENVLSNDIVAISSTEEFMNKDSVDYHFFGAVNFFYTENSRANPLFEKYPILIILDILSCLILKKLDLENNSFLQTIKTKNII